MNYTDGIPDSMTFDEVADMFMATMVGQSTGISRADLLVKLRVQYPTQEVLDMAMADFKRRFNAGEAFTGAG